MKIIISPAKKMNFCQESSLSESTPVFLKQAEQLKNYLQTLSYSELKTLLGCNEKIASLNFRRYQSMDLSRALSLALLSYEGIQYQYMAPHIFTYSQFDYVQKHLRILSGLYGILKPLDGIVPYRLEMQAKLPNFFCRTLYDFWGDAICRELIKDDNVILNLASAEYAKCVKKYIPSDVSYLTCIFGEMESGRIREKGVYVKMARGEMVRYMAENNIQSPEEVKKFDRLGYSFQSGLSSEKQYIFLK